MLALAFYRFLKRKLSSQPIEKILKSLILYSVIFYAAYAAILTLGQYYIWSQSEFGRTLLNSPLNDKSLVDVLAKFSWLADNSLGYFIFYSYGRFWLEILISVALAAGFYLFLKLLKKHNDRFFENGETELGFLTALIVGWPKFIIFLPLIFVFVILVSIFRRVYFKEFYTTLGWPMLWAALITLIIGNTLIEIFNFGVLRI
ncbi:MAG: hypothetical protein AAB596_02675 [Patescibacteria group bacterium]